MKSKISYMKFCTKIVSGTLLLHARWREQQEKEAERQAAALEAEQQAAELRYAQQKAKKEQDEERDRLRDANIVEYRRKQKLRNESKNLVEEHLQQVDAADVQEIPQPKLEDHEDLPAEIGLKV